jgi:hypothetical protein
VASRCEHRRRQRTWQWFVTALLVGLLLYNPFLALGNSSGGLAYQELARHRATVGASEMQHFASTRAACAQPEARQEEVFQEPPVETREFPRFLFREQIVLPGPAPADSIWFRPPPEA